MLSGVWLALLMGLAVPPNILLISIDTLRPDHLGSYGYGRSTSPNLDRLAAEALLFEDCVCEVPLTSPSLGAMMSSRFPRMTGTRRNGLRMPPEVPLVAELFREAGYYTFCVQSNWTLKAKLCGLDRGFDVYEDDFHTKRWGFIKPERYADAVTRVAQELFSSRDPAKPFFGWVHYSDPHAPYRKHWEHNPAGVKTWHLKKKERVRARYDSEIAFADAELGRLLAVLPANTAVVFVADHGESLYEHDYLGHGRRIYQPGLQIPLIIRAAGVAPGRTRIPARGVDLGPTLLGLAGLPPANGMLGVDLLHSNVAMNRARVVETYGGAVPRLPGAKAMMAGRRPMRQGVLLEGWKLIQDGRKSELFQLGQDPGELHNLAEAEPARVEQLRSIIAQWDTTVENSRESENALSQDDLQALESLGYIK